MNDNSQLTIDNLNRHYGSAALNSRNGGEGKDMGNKIDYTARYIENILESNNK